MGDDAGAGIYTLDVPDTTTFQRFAEILYKGGYGNTWPVPANYHDSYWIIQTNIGVVAFFICDHEEELHLEYLKFNKNMLVKDLNIHSVYACRPVGYWRVIDQNNYREVVQKLQTAASNLKPLDLRK